MRLQSIDESLLLIITNDGELSSFTIFKDGDCSHFVEVTRYDGSIINLDKFRNSSEIIKIIFDPVTDDLPMSGSISCENDNWVFSFDHIDIDPVYVFQKSL